MGDRFGKGLRVCDPPFDSGLGGQRFDEVPLFVDIRHRLGEIRGIPLRELGNSVNTSLLKKIRVLLADALDPHEIRAIYPAKNELLGRTTTGREGCATLVDDMEVFAKAQASVRRIINRLDLSLPGLWPRTDAA